MSRKSQLVHEPYGDRPSYQEHVVKMNDGKEFKLYDPKRNQFESYSKSLKKYSKIYDKVKSYAQDNDDKLDGDGMPLVDHYKYFDYFSQAAKDTGMGWGINDKIWFPSIKMGERGYAMYLAMSPIKTIRASKKAKLAAGDETENEATPVEKVASDTMEVDTKSKRAAAGDDDKKSEKEKIKAVAIKIKGEQYALNKANGEIYEYESFVEYLKNKRKTPFVVGERFDKDGKAIGRIDSEKLEQIKKERKEAEEKMKRKQEKEDREYEKIMEERRKQDEEYDKAMIKLMDAPEKLRYFQSKQKEEEQEIIDDVKEEYDEKIKKFKDELKKKQKERDDIEEDVVNYPGGPGSMAPYMRRWEEEDEHDREILQGFEEERDGEIRSIGQKRFDEWNRGWNDAVYNFKKNKGKNTRKLTDILSMDYPEPQLFSDWDYEDNIMYRSAYNEAWDEAFKEEKREEEEKWEKEMEIEQEKFDKEYEENERRLAEQKRIDDEKAKEKEEKERDLKSNRKKAFRERVRQKAALEMQQKGNMKGDNKVKPPAAGDDIVKPPAAGDDKPLEKISASENKQLTEEDLKVERASLPSGWDVGLSKKWNKFYYFKNNSTNEEPVWEKPQASAPLTDEQLNIERASLPNNWDAAISNTWNRFYYFKKGTNERQWHKPSQNGGKKRSKKNKNKGNKKTKRTHKRSK